MIRLNEKKIIEDMIVFYCKKNHLSDEDYLCINCKNLLEYSINKLKKCKYVNKPVCSNCTVHCYQKNYRNEIIKVMKFSGFNYLIKHPYIGIKFILKKIFKI
ncbi:MAG: nitrous oxide-stimulated promoter family protein [Spirochaetes bacterium]|nr:nitrous oxide-stimulated promoter family protein [Spirochaetota bacterium]